MNNVKSSVLDQEPRRSRMIALWRSNRRKCDIAAELGVTLGTVSWFVRSRSDLCPPRAPNASHPQAFRQRVVPPQVWPSFSDVTARFECLGEAVLAQDGGCRWPCEDAGGVWFCGGRRLTLRVRDSDALGVSSYCAEHYHRSVQRAAVAQGLAA